MYRESLQNNRERILLSRRLATIHCEVPIPFDLKEFTVQAPDIEPLKALYKDLEFFSQLKELGPSEDSRPRDFRPLETPEALRDWIAAIPKGATLSIALSADDIGLSCRTGKRAACPFHA